LVGGSASILTKGLADGLYVHDSNLSVTTVTEDGLTGPAIGLGGGSATGPDSFATMGGSASGQRSTASGYGAWAYGNESTASGYDAYAHGIWSTASGAGSKAWGNDSTASGFYSTASGNYSTASGVYSTASGFYSTAAGDHSSAQSYGEFVVGQYNVIEGSTNSWVSTDDLFVVGSGTSSETRSDAIEVLKNGNTTVGGSLTVSGTTASTFAGPVTVAPGGDIPMFSGGD
jgi:hypothetical protein